jgi:MraZ protein
VLSASCEQVDETPKTTTTAAKCYNSLYRHGLDPKRRLQVPSKWRSEEGGDELTVVIWRQYGGVGACLRVLPAAELARVRQTISNLPAGDPLKTALRHMIGPDSEQVTLDTAGRLLLPERMAQEAGLDGEAVMVGLLDYFEIWNSERYQKVRIFQEMQAQEAFKLMD